jgi:hypothetical protein
MAPVVHPGRHLKREMVARHLSAIGLRWMSACPPAALRISSTADERSPPTLPFGLAVILPTVLSSGWACKANTAPAWSSARGAEIARRARPADVA